MKEDNVNSQYPFTRTSVILTSIIAGALLLGGVIAIVAFVPDAGPRISTILTITLPTSAIALLGVAISIRNGKLVASTHETVTAVQAQTNGVTSALLAHALGTRTLDTTELAVIAQKVDQNAKGGK
jgi:hypothetical protein